MSLFLLFSVKSFLGLVFRFRLDDLQLNIASRDVFAFPSDDDIHSLTSIPEIEARIKDVLLVLSNFSKFREKERFVSNIFWHYRLILSSTRVKLIIIFEIFRYRADYIALLKRDLCTYFSYNEFLMERIMNLFPLDELMNFLEASETQRPVTIRTNSLKIRRRDLAQVRIYFRM